MEEPVPITLQDMEETIQRLIDHYRRVLPQRVERGRMERVTAKRVLGALEGVLLLVRRQRTDGEAPGDGSG